LVFPTKQPGLGSPSAALLYPKCGGRKKTWFKQKEQAHDHALFIHANGPTFQINLEIVFGQTSLSEEPGGRYSFAGVGRG